MGTTGVGKTCFVSQAIGQELERHESLDCSSKTKPRRNYLLTISVSAGSTGILEHEFRHWELDMDVRLVDTPGFDDPNKSDHVLLGEFAEYLQHLSSQGLSLWGIIYFHSINDTRMFRSAQ